MSYYQRPMGDYKTYGYAGDPGFLSSLWKGIKKVGKVALTAAFPVPAMVYGALRGKPQPPQPQFVAGGMPTSFPGVGAVPGTLPAMLGRAPMSFAGQGLGQAAVAPDATGCCPSGYHLDKRTGTKCVRNRRMNVANPRALRRSMRRVQGFEKLARRTIQFTRRVKMKKGRTS